MDGSYCDMELPEIYHSTPLRALRMSARKKLSGFLDIEGILVVCGQVDVVNDYTGLAELAGFSNQNILNMKRQRSPTIELLDQWTGRLSATIGVLWQFLAFMERFDVLSDCRACIIRDCEVHEEQQTRERDAHLYNVVEQDPTVPTTKKLIDETRNSTTRDVPTTKKLIDETRNSTTRDVSTTKKLIDETRYSTTTDVKTGRKTYYDAFICYTQEDDSDRKFLFEMIGELERERKLKLFVPGRDDLPGSAEHTITAYLIEERCRRVIILISRKFLQSEVCDFQLKFAHALSPGARSKKLIPVVREKDTPIPRILLGHVLVDFSSSAIIEWSWNRIHMAITAPIGSATYFEADDPSTSRELEDSLKQIAYPIKRRMYENEDNSEYNALFPEAGTNGSGSVNIATRSGPVEHEMYFSQPSTSMQSNSPEVITGVSMSAQNGKRNPTTCSKTSQSPTSTAATLTLKRAITMLKQQIVISSRKPDRKRNALI